MPERSVPSLLAHPQSAGRRYHLTACCRDLSTVSIYLVTSIIPSPNSVSAEDLVEAKSSCPFPSHAPFLIPHQKVRLLPNFSTPSASKRLCKPNRPDSFTEEPQRLHQDHPSRETRRSASKHTSECTAQQARNPRLASGPQRARWRPTAQDKALPSKPHTRQ